jgi:site-specific DNA-methyltransferase (adenine-specific)/site-specific DNA-methyltransferase (cytosine-N4-specific)
VPPDKYVEWFLPRAYYIAQALKSDGTFILNIKEGCEDGERETYILELILALKKQGWKWTEEYIWHKKTCMPGGWPNRFRDAWEHVFQFNKSRDFYINKDAVKVPSKESTIQRAINAKDEVVYSSTGSGFNRNIRSSCVDESYPSNVLYFAAECTNVGHSAAFPRDLPRFFIKAFSRPGDLILDPFIGSGTTGLEALELNRNFIGFEKVPEHVKTANERIFKGCATLDYFVDKEKVKA